MAQLVNFEGGKDNPLLDRISNFASRHEVTDPHIFAQEESEAGSTL